MPDDKPDTSNPFGSPAPTDDSAGEIFLGIEEGEEFDSEAADPALPVPGTYRCRCIHAERRDSQNGNPMIVLTYKIVGDPKYTDVEFTDKNVLMHKTVRLIARLYKAYGIETKGRTSVPITAFVGKEVSLDLAHREWEGQMYIDVKKVKPYVASAQEELKF